MEIVASGEVVRERVGNKTRKLLFFLTNVVELFACISLIKIKAKNKEKK